MCKRTPYSEDLVTTRVWASLKGRGKVLLYVHNPTLYEDTDQVTLERYSEHDCTCRKCGKEWILKTTAKDTSKLYIVKETCPECQIKALLN